MKQPETPFPRHWIYYVALKIMILVIGLAIALWVFGIL
jgi:hypothetical protein